MTFDPYAMLIDFCTMSVFLVIAQILRSKLKILQNFYIPSSLLAGFFGLFCGPQFLGIAPFSDKASSYAYLLVCVLFAGLFLGKTEKISVGKIVNKVGDTFLINMSSEILGFAFPLVVGGALMMVLFPNVFNEICLLLPAGFTGGHGYAAAIGGTLNNLLGRDDCVIIGQTFATFGLLVGIFGGLIAINFATRKGATRLVSTIGSLPEACKTGMVPPKERKSIGDETVHPMSMDPLAWHVALVLFATGLGYGAYQLYKPYMPNIEVPMMCLTMLAGVLIQTVLNKTGYGGYVDKRVIDRIGSGVTDYLVCFGVATIKISVVMNFIGPIILMSVIGALWAYLVVFVIGRKLFRNFWFERSIFIFGYITGVVAIGVTLLRIVDPENKSGTLDDFGTAYTLQSVIELFIVTMTPVFVVSMGAVPVGLVLLVIGFAMLALCRIRYGSFSLPMNQLREGEAEVVGQSN